MGAYKNHLIMKFVPQATLLIPSFYHLTSSDFWKFWHSFPEPRGTLTIHGKKHVGFVATISTTKIELWKNRNTTLNWQEK